MINLLKKEVAIVKVTGTEEQCKKEVEMILAIAKQKGIECEVEMNIVVNPKQSFVSYVKELINFVR